jgi:hypothetical protein
MSEPNIRISSYGGDGGVKFDREEVREIGFRADAIVEALILNGVHHGSQSLDSLTDILVLKDGEYINYVNIRTSNVAHRLSISRLIFRTNMNREVQGGAGGDADNRQNYDLNNVKVLSIGGSAADWLDRIEIEYETN